MGPTALSLQALTIAAALSAAAYIAVRIAIAQKAITQARADY
jgi:hypothetical protein